MNRGTRERPTLGACTRAAAGQDREQTAQPAATRPSSRASWQVFGSPRGGQVGARLFSLVLSAKLAGVNVQEYLEDVLGRVSTVKAKDVAALTPWGWAAGRERLGQAG